ncbi:hypothetical protein SDC9_182121 [bioreactor metagenome]|uniref:Uncharacterized protein n=1 Tax=bioreactor metagenome TaxID=1076179 RepID=A0A645H6G8_9ZZZZ
MEHIVAEGRHHPLQHLTAVQGARVVHRSENPEHLQIGVEALLHLLDGVGEQRDAAQGEELQLQRHQHPVGTGQRIHRQ